MDAFDLMSDFDEDQYNIEHIKVDNEQLQNQKIEKIKSTNENTNGKEMTVPSSDVKNENSLGDEFTKADHILGKRSYNQEDICELSPTNNHENDKNS